jgi:hypothetical protein
VNTSKFGIGLTLSDDSLYYWHGSVLDNDTAYYQSFSFTPNSNSGTPSADMILLRLNAEGDAYWGKQAFGNQFQNITKHATFPSGVALLGHSPRTPFTVDGDTIDERAFVLVFQNESDSLVHHFQAPLETKGSKRLFTSFNTHKDSTFTFTISFNDSISIADTTLFTISPLPPYGVQGSLLLKYSYDGALLSVMKLGDGTIRPYDHLIDEEGNILLLGTYMKYGASLPILGNDTLSGNGLFLAKISTTNEVLWVKGIEVVRNLLWGAPSELWLRQSPDGSMVICAELYDGGGIIIDEDTIGSPDKPGLLLARLNSQGEILWTSFPDIKDTRPFPYTSMPIGPDNQVAIGGELLGTAIFNNDTLHSGSDRDSDLFLVVYDSTGEVEYATTSDSHHAVPGFRARAKVWGFNHLGELIVTGFFLRSNLQLGPHTLDQASGNQFIAALAPGPGPTGIEAFQDLRIRIAPNPARDHIRIRLLCGEVALGKPYGLSLYDMQGKRTARAQAACFQCAGYIGLRYAVWHVCGGDGAWRASLSEKTHPTQMKTLLTSLILGLCCLSGFSQNYHWKWVKSGNHGGWMTLAEDSVYYWYSTFMDSMDYQGFSFIETPSPRVPSGGDIALLRLNAAGDAVWGKQAFGRSSERFLRHASFASGVALLGIAGDTITIDNDTIDERGFVLIFSNESDRLEHYFRAPRPTEGRLRQYFSFDAHEDSTFTFLVGFNDTITIGDTTFQTIEDFGIPPIQHGSLLLKYDYNGEMLWVRKTGDGQLTPSNHFVDEEGNIVMIGIYGAQGPFLPVMGNDTFPGEGIFIAKVSASNELLWTKSIPVLDNYVLAPKFSIAQAPDNAIMICLEFNRSEDLIIDEDTIINGDKPALVMVKLNERGEVIWTDFPNLEHSYPPYFVNMAVGDEGQVAIAGQLIGTAIFGEDTLRSDSTWDMFLVVYDATGKVSYATTSDTKTAGARSWAEASAWGFNHLGELIITGSFTGPRLQIGPFSLEQTSPIPGIGTGFIAALAPGPGPTGIEAFQDLRIRIAPNPARDHIRIRLLGGEVALGKPYGLSLYDMQGKRLLHERKRLASNTLDISVADMPYGMYVVELVYGGQVYREKLVVAQ